MPCCCCATWYETRTASLLLNSHLRWRFCGVNLLQVAKVWASNFAVPVFSHSSILEFLMGLYYQVFAPRIIRSHHALAWMCYFANELLCLSIFISQKHGLVCISVGDLTSFTFYSNKNHKSHCPGVQSLRSGSFNHSALVWCVHATTESFSLTLFHYHYFFHLNALHLASISSL